MIVAGLSNVQKKTKVIPISLKYIKKLLNISQLASRIFLTNISWTSNYQNKSSERRDFQNKLLKNRKEYEKNCFLSLLRRSKKELIFMKKYHEGKHFGKSLSFRKSEGNKYLK